MPVTKSAKKKLKQDKKRTESNEQLKELFKSLVKKARKNPTPESVRVATQVADKSAKKGLIHHNKANRVKASLAKLLPKQELGAKKEVKSKTTPKKVVKAPTKKATKKQA